MLKKIVQYETSDGSIFDSYSKAKLYESKYEKRHKIINALINFILVEINKKTNDIDTISDLTQLIIDCSKVEKYEKLTGEAIEDREEYYTNNLDDFIYELLLILFPYIKRFLENENKNIEKYYKYLEKNDDSEDDEDDDNEDDDDDDDDSEDIEDLDYNDTIKNYDLIFNIYNENNEYENESE